MGGKSLLASRIVPLMPEHKCYVEVFAGAAWLLFKKPESPAEVVNDINTDLATLYRVVQHHLDEFVRYFRWALISREEFERLKAAEPRALTDIQRAARFYYLTRQGFSGKLVSPSFGISTERPPRLNLLRIEEELSAAHLRLSRVYVENLPYQEVIERYDRPHTLFYVDPPYYGCEDYYGVGIFSRQDFNALEAILARLKGRFILSLNDVPEVRDIFSRFHITEIKTRYSAGSADRNKPVVELLISNFKM
jgi:DNA adenine methylase